jgi:starvation-inducible DNA-binding protein
MARRTDRPSFTVPSLTLQDGALVAEILQQRLHSLIDLTLTLKHVHWNVVGPNFIGVHQMIDPQVDAVRVMVDATAERIATLGVSPIGTPGALVTARTWDDYSIGRAGVLEHLGALDVVYDAVIAAHRKAAKDTDELDPVTNDLLIGHLHQLELFQWFIRAHLESSGGTLSTAGSRTERGAAANAGAAAGGAPAASRKAKEK